MQTKICNKCNNEFPATLDYFFAQKKGKYGVRAKCKQCLKEYASEYRSTPEYRERHRLEMIEYRKKKPQLIKKINDKSRNKNKEIYNEKRRYLYKTDTEYKQKKIEQERKYKESGRRYFVGSKPEQREKAVIRSRNRRLNPEKRIQDYKYGERYRNENRIVLNEKSKIKRIELHDSYVAHTLDKFTHELTPEIIEQKRLIIKLKRELKSNNIKIK